MKINSKHIERLIEQSKTKSYDPYERFHWPESVAVDRLWCDEELLTTYGTDIHKNLTEEQMYTLSKWEAINFFSLNVHGIKTALEFVSKCFYNKRYEGISEYLHMFLFEENAHMWFFARFCQYYGGKIYPSYSIANPSVGNDLEADLYMFASTLIFEEFVDFYNFKVGKNRNVPEIVREINHQHHLDESRHVSFGREVIKELYREVVESNEDPGIVSRINDTLKKLIIYFVGLMYSPLVYADAEIAQPCGFQSAASLRNHLRNSPMRGAYNDLWFRRTAKFFFKWGMIDDKSFVKVC